MTLQNRSGYEEDRDKKVNELQALGFDRAKLVRAGVNALDYLHSGVVLGIGMSEGVRQSFLNTFGDV